MSDEQATEVQNPWGFRWLPPNVSAGLFQAALEGRETLHLETKRVSGKMVAKALETLCAFANTQGGWLILGMEDADKAQGTARYIGVDENPEAVDELLRKVSSQIQPPLDALVWWFEPKQFFSPAGTRTVRLLVAQVKPSDKVHSLVDGGTWLRLQASNRQMSAAEVTELSYRRGVRSAEAEPVDVDFDLLDTDTWRMYLRGRGLASTGIADQLYRIGLARKVDGHLRPLRAAVLLFADDPGGLLAAIGTRADVRVFHYKGNAIVAGEVPNLRKPPRTLSGPLYQLIAQVHAYLLDDLAEGLTLASSGFRTVHRYPERVIKEALTNAVIHRDYRLNRDIQIHIFDNRIEVLSPGMFPGRITAATVHRTGSLARNPLIAKNLREFPEPPNVDAGEGVKMMFNLMHAGRLYPPLYREMRDQAQDAISLTLLNEESPPVWEQVSEWIDRNGPIANSDLCAIAELDTLKASKLLKRWVGQGLLEADTSRGKRYIVYRKTAADTDSPLGSLSAGPDNELQ